MILIVENHSQLIIEPKAILCQNFNKKDLGHLRYFLGKDEILLNQRKYTLQLLSNISLSGAKTVIHQQKFAIIEYDQHKWKFHGSLTR